MATQQTQDIDLDMNRLEYEDDPTSRRHAVLTLTTRKYYGGGIISDAIVYWDNGRSRQHRVSLGGNGSDYDKRLHLSEKTVKATQRNIDRQHTEIFTPEVVAILTQSAKAHYSQKASA